MIEKLISKVSLNVKGKNINRFIKKLRSKKIEILSLKYKDSNQADIIIYKKDYEKVLKIKSIYEITELDVFGLIKIKRKIKLSKHLIIITIISFIIFLIFTHVIFNVEVIHSNKDIRILLLTELEKEGIKKYSFKKSYKEITKIKEKILNKYPDKIEWLEIESTGTKYTVRVEEREIIKKEEDNTPRNIIAGKDGVLKKVIAEKGNIVKDMNDYVKKGDLIVNGELIFNEKVTGKVKATGKAYAEVWYVTKTEYPFAAYEEKETGKTKDVYAIKFLNHTFEFALNKFKTKKINEEEIIKHPLIPIKLVKQKQTETKVTDIILTPEEAISKAKEKAIDEIKKNLSKDEYIIRSKYLKSTVKESIVEVEMFFAVYEDITDYAEIGWCKLIRSSILEILGEVWPTILISSVIAISMRLVYLIKNKQKIILYREMLSLIFIIYVLCLFYVVTFGDVGWSNSNFIPFKEMFRYSFGSNLFIKNVLGNIIMFVPYGFFVSYYLDLKKPLSAFLLVLLVSTSIETTQLLIGRVFDIDDIILNIVGGMIGFVIYKLLDLINDHLPSVLKNPIVYNIIIVLCAIFMAMYMFNLIELGV